MYSLPPYKHNLLHYQHHSPDGTFFFFWNKDEPTLTHHNHSKSVACLRVHSWSCMVYGLNKCMIAYLHHYNIIQSIFTSLKILCALCSSFIWFSVYGIPWKMSELNSRTRRDMTFFILLVNIFFFISCNKNFSFVSPNSFYSPLSPSWWSQVMFSWENRSYQLFPNIPNTKSSNQPVSACNFMKLETLILVFWVFFDAFIFFLRQCSLSFCKTTSSLTHSSSVWLPSFLLP